MTIGTELVKLFNAAMAESIPALLIWLLAVAILRAFKRKMTLHSAWILLAILLVLTVFHIIYLTPL